MAFKGKKFTIYGAFKSKAKARAREHAHKGAFIQPRTIRGHKRYIVMKER